MLLQRARFQREPQTFELQKSPKPQRSRFYWAVRSRDYCVNWNTPGDPHNPSTALPVGGISPCSEVSRIASLGYRAIEHDRQSMFPVG